MVAGRAAGDAAQLGLGCVKLGSIAAGTGWRESVRLVHRAIDRGITYFDTADAYGAGTSEHVLGRALRGRRSTVTIATKGGYVFAERSRLERRARVTAAGLLRRVRPTRPTSASSPTGPTSPTSPSVAGRVHHAAAYADQDFSPAHLTDALHGSLRRLRTEHVDVYQLHGPREADADAIGDWAAEMVAAGKIGRLGVGAEDLDQARRWIGCRGMASVQVPFGVLDPEAGDELIPIASAAGLAVVTRGVLGAGLLGTRPAGLVDQAGTISTIDELQTLASASGVGVVQLALWFVRSRPEVDTIVVGASSRHHVDDVADAIATALPESDVLASLDAIAARRRRHDDAG